MDTKIRDDNFTCELITPYDAFGQIFCAATLQVCFDNKLIKC